MPLNETHLETGGRALTITPVKVRDLPAFLRAVEPLAGALAEGDILAALTHNAEGLIAATAIGAGVDRVWLEEQTLDVLVELAAAVLEVNAGFFAQRVLPVVTRAAEGIAALTMNPGGTA